MSICNFLSLDLSLSVATLPQFSRVGLAISMYASSKTGERGGEREGCATGEDEHAFLPIRNSELYPHNSKVVGKATACIHVYIHKV